MKQNEQSEAGHKRFLFVKKRLKRAAALAGILIISLSLSGCKNFVETDVGAETKITEKVKDTETTSLINPEFHYITDWSIDELVKNIEMNGISYSMPLTVEDLGEKYSIEEYEDYDNCFFLNYCDDEYALIDIYNDNESDIKKNRIRTINVSYDVDFKIGGISFGDEKDDILKKYGEPSLSSPQERVLTYVFEGETEEQNNVLVLTFSKNEKLDGISVGYNKYRGDNQNE